MNTELRERALQFIEKLDEETGTMWTEDDDKIAKAFVDFHKQELSGKEIYVAVSVEDELPEAEDKVICFRGTERLIFSWPAREFKVLKVTHWLKKLTLSGEESSKH